MVERTAAVNKKISRRIFLGAGTVLGVGLLGAEVIAWIGADSRKKGENYFDVFAKDGSPDSDYVARVNSQGEKALRDRYNPHPPFNLGDAVNAYADEEAPFLDTLEERKGCAAEIKAASPHLFNADDSLVDTLHPIPVSREEAPSCFIDQNPPPPKPNPLKDFVGRVRNALPWGVSAGLLTSAGVLAAKAARKTRQAYLNVRTQGEVEVAQSLEWPDYRDSDGQSQIMEYSDRAIIDRHVFEGYVAQVIEEELAKRGVGGTVTKMVIGPNRVVTGIEVSGENLDKAQKVVSGQIRGLNPKIKHTLQVQHVKYDISYGRQVGDSKFSDYLIVDISR